MFTNIERSRLHAAAHSALKLQDEPTGYLDRRKGALIDAFAAFGGTVSLVQILASAEALEDFLGGEPADLTIRDLMDAAPLSVEEAKAVFAVLGARPLGSGAFKWTTAEDGQHSTETKIPPSIFADWATGNLTN